MPKLRKEFTQDFTIIYNTILRDKRVGSSPRGVYCTMVSMSDGWNFTIRGLAAVMGEGVTKIARGESIALCPLRYFQSLLMTLQH